MLLESDCSHVITASYKQVNSQKEAALAKAKVCGEARRWTCSCSMRSSGDAITQEQGTALLELT